MRTFKEYVNEAKKVQNKKTYFVFDKKKYEVVDYYEGTELVTKGSELIKQYVDRYNSSENIEAEIKYDLDNHFIKEV